MTRARTPGSLSTRTDDGVCCDAASCRAHTSTMPSSDTGLAGAVVGAEQHLVVRRAGRDHREAVLGLVDQHVDDDRLLDVDHLLDHLVELGRLVQRSPTAPKASASFTKSGSDSM